MPIPRNDACQRVRLEDPTSDRRPRSLAESSGKKRLCAVRLDALHEPAGIAVNRRSKDHMDVMVHHAEGVQERTVVPTVIGDQRDEMLSHLHPLEAGDKPEAGSRGKHRATGLGESCHLWLPSGMSDYDVGRGLLPFPGPLPTRKACGAIKDHMIKTSKGHKLDL